MQTGFSTMAGHHAPDTGHDNPISGERQSYSRLSRNRYMDCHDRMPSFRLGTSVAQNVANLRVALGSATRALSRDDLAKLITEQHPTRVLSGSSVERWEKDGVEPDYESAAIMARLAGVPFEAFALGDTSGRPETHYDVADNPSIPDPEMGKARGRKAR